MTLVQFKFVFGPLSLDSGITPRLCKVERHGLAKQLETVDLINGILRALNLVENDKGLTSALQAAFGDNVYNVSIFAEDFAECLH